MISLALIAGLTLSGAPPANKPTRLKLDVKPETCVIFVDGKKKGTAAKTLYVPVTPGRHAIKVMNGKDAVEDSAVVKKGETLGWKWEFTDDRPGKKPSAATEESTETPPAAETPPAPDSPPTPDSTKP